MNENTSTTARVSVRATAGGMAGGVIEWFDFSLYGFMAVIMAKLFFPAEDASASLLATYGVFAIGFLMRPLGGLLFGYLGDRIGRKNVLLLSVLMMATGVVLIGLLPTYHEWGIWAPICLIAIRMVQGLSAGGEVSGATTYLVEAAPDRRRAFAASWANVGVITGMLLGSGTPALVIWLLGSDDVAAWGWRIPFLLGGLLGFIALLLRRAMPDPTAGEADARAHEGYRPLKRLFAEERGVFVRVTIFAAAYGVIVYIPTVYLPTWISLYTPVSLHAALFVVTLALCLQAALLPLAGMSTDRLVRRTKFLSLVCLVMTAAALPLFMLASSGTMPAAAATIVLFAVIVAGAVGVAPTTFAEAFDRGHRMSGYSLAFGLGFGISGGTAPMIATWLIEQTGHHLAPAFYLMAFAVIGFATILTLKDRSRDPLR